MCAMAHVWRSEDNLGYWSSPSALFEAKSTLVVYHLLHTSQASCVRTQVLLQPALSNSAPADTRPIITCCCQVWCISNATTNCIFFYAAYIPLERFLPTSQLSGLFPPSVFQSLCLPISLSLVLSCPHSEMSFLFSPQTSIPHLTLPINFLH